MKVTFIGAGSTIFAKNTLGDLILTKEVGPFEIALFDIDHERLTESYVMLNKINHKYQGLATIEMYQDRKEALRNADFIINAIQVGGYEPCTVWDFEIPKKYGLKQTIADTIGIGGIMRALRTIPVLDSIAKDIKEVCPNALFINYSNPMSMLTGYLINDLGIKTIGLCHSVQVCVKGLFETLDMMDHYDGHQSLIYGINHQSWLLDIKDKSGRDLYPEVFKRSFSGDFEDKKQWDLVRHEIMKHFGYYNTESSEHTAEYSPYFIKDKYPEMIKRFNIPLDEYMRRCETQIADWKTMKKDIVENDDIIHEKSNEYLADIVKAVVTNQDFIVHANINNDGWIPNLPQNSCVEVPCVVNAKGITPTKMPALPEQLAALNRTMINVHLTTLQAARTKNRKDVYRAAMLDPHTSSELSFDDIIAMCDELLEVEKDWHEIK
jgi:alpha-galactosidase